MEALSPAEAVEALASPLALERFSALTGQDLLAIDFSAYPSPGAERPRLEAALERLGQLACPSVAVGLLAASDDAARLHRACDLVVDDRAALGPVVAAARRNPQAALALVQLLRLGQDRPLHDALVAESLVYSTLQSGPEFAAWLSRRGAPRPPAPRSGPCVRVERHGRALWLVLDRADRRNAFSAAMRDGLVEGLAVAIADPSIDAIVLRGEGPSFCAGGDLDEFGSLPDPATAHAVRSVRNAARMLSACADRVRAELHGACVGAGIELPAFAARVVATPEAFFELPEVGMGLVPGAGGTASLPRRIGRQRTAWWALTGARIDAATALDWGLVDAVEERDDAS